MQTSLYIRLASTPQGEITWLRRDAQGASAPQHGTLAEAAARPGERVVVLLPAAALLPLLVTLPPLQGQKLRRAVPYAAEEQLAEDVEALHFALGKRQADGSLPLLAVEHARMRGWLEQLAEAEIKPHACYDEGQLLPWQAGEFTLLLEQHGALLRVSGHEAYSLPLEGLQAWLELAVQRAPEAVTRLRIVDARGEGAAEPPLEGELATLSVDYERQDEPLALLAAAPLTQTIDLLQGEYGRKEQFGRLWRPWRLSAALLLGWLLLQGGESLYDYSRLHDEESRLYASVEQVYRDTFPEAKNVVNPRVQMERKLAELKGGGGGGAFTSLLAATAPALNAINNLTLQSLRYRQGELDVELKLADLPALDTLKEKLQQQGLAVEIRSASSREQQVESRVIIRGAGA